MQIVTADGLTTDKAYCNAGAADERMEGVRVEIAISNGTASANVYAEDRDAAMRWTAEELRKMLDTAKNMAVRGEVEMCDDREVDAWII